MSEHDHDHSHASITNGDEPAAAARARALEELLVEEEVPPDALAPLAEAIEETIPPPYKAEGVRRGEHVWGCLLYTSPSPRD